jgi:hypothetical protein
VNSPQGNFAREKLSQSSRAPRRKNVFSKNLTRSTFGVASITKSRVNYLVRSVNFACAEDDAISRNRFRDMHVTFSHRHPALRETRFDGDSRSSFQVQPRSAPRPDEQKYSCQRRDLGSALVASEKHLFMRRRTSRCPRQIWTERGDK